MRFDCLTRISLNNLRPLLSLFSADLAIDLGTVNTRVYARGRGIVVNEPSAVALDDRTGEVQAVGKEAKEMLGRTPAKIRVVKPLKDGVIADFKVTEKMLNYFIQKAHQRRTLVHPRITISIPSEITQVEKRAVTDAAYRAKAAEVHLVPDPTEREEQIRLRAYALYEARGREDGPTPAWSGSPEHSHAECAANIQSYSVFPAGSRTLWPWRH